MFDYCHAWGHGISIVKPQLYWNASLANESISTNIGSGSYTIKTHNFSHGGCSWSAPDLKGGGGPPPLRTPKLSHGTMRFVGGAGGAGDFVLGIRHREFFLFDPMCLYSKYSEFRGEFKNG